MGLHQQRRSSGRDQSSRVLLRNQANAPRADVSAGNSELEVPVVDLCCELLCESRDHTVSVRIQVCAYTDRPYYSIKALLLIIHVFTMNEALYISNADTSIIKLNISNGSLTPPLLCTRQFQFSEQKSIDYIFNMHNAMDRTATRWPI
jgi:hypothetical protein